ncbi:unnamed protein product, partial [Ectocarpus sp. 12 AP-2014]
MWRRWARDMHMVGRAAQSFLLWSPRYFRGCCTDCSSFYRLRFVGALSTNPWCHARRMSIGSSRLCAAQLQRRTGRRAPYGTLLRPEQQEREAVGHKLALAEERHRRKTSNCP